MSKAGDASGQPKPGKAGEAGELEKAGEVVPPKEGEAGPKPGEEQAGRPMKAATLRQAFEELKKEKREILEPKIQSLESKLKEIETAGGQVPKQFQEKLAATEKRNAELEAHIEFLDYEKSTKFEKEHKQPYSEAWFSAVADFSQLKVREATGELGEDGQPIYRMRQATDQDLLKLGNLDLSEMDEEAEAMFGKSAPRVIRHVERVRELATAQDKALKDAKSRAGEASKMRSFQMQQYQQQEHSFWEQCNKEIAEKFPAVFGPVEGDADGNALLQKGFEEADRLFSPDPKAKPQTAAERIQFHTKLRNKIANHDRLFRQNKSMKAELEEAKKALAEYEDSAPPAGRGGSPRAPSKDFMQEVDAELDKMDKA
jgi:hypothetical protein